MNAVLASLTSIDTFFQVELLAYGKLNEIRQVDVPVEEIEFATIGEKLDRIFYHGQNEFQPKRHPSVSMGDVVRIDHDKYLICAAGFRKLTADEYDEYVATERVERSFVAMRLTGNVE